MRKWQIIELARGHWGHKGRPGKRGGSLPGKGGGGGQDPTYGDERIFNSITKHEPSDDSMSKAAKSLKDDMGIVLGHEDLKLYTRGLVTQNDILEAVVDKHGAFKDPDYGTEVRRRTDVKTPGWAVKPVDEFLITRMPRGNGRPMGGSRNPQWFYPSSGEALAGVAGIRKAYREERSLLKKYGVSGA